VSNRIPSVFLPTLTIVAVLFSLTSAGSARAQGIVPPQRLAENAHASIAGLITVRVQQDTGASFLGTAKVTLRSGDMTVDMQSNTAANGQAEFSFVPLGAYLVEVSAPGYSTVRQQLSLTRSGEAQEMLVSMIAETGIGTSHSAAAANVSPKAIKETEKGLRALQIGRLNETQGHLTRALAYSPDFADGNYLMGVLFLRRNDAGQALTYLQKAVDEAPSHAPALLALGEAAYLQGNVARANASLEQCLRAQPKGAQATAARELIARMRDSGPLPTTESGGGGEKRLASQLVSSTVSVNTLLDSTALAPVTETNWLPPDVDEQKAALDPNAPCQLDQVIQATGVRVKELVENVDRFTASENVDHYKLSPLGLEISKETRKFDYMVEIRPLGTHDLDVQEFRNGSVSGAQFPGHIATNGLPTLALVFHPYYQEKYQFVCEGRGVWRGSAAWLVHFQQRTDLRSAMLVYRVGTKSYEVGLKGRAWVDVNTSQILAIETDTMRPVPEIRLVRDHQLIEYGPVDFKNGTMHLWLPKSADWYSSLSGQRYHRRHTFSQFLLFSVDDSQKIGKPKEDADQVPKT
jgi:hypothetical protein